MKIAILADPLDNQTAGVHTYTRELVNALIKHDSENEFILIRQKIDPNLPFKQVIVPNIRLPIGFASFRLFFIIPLIAKKLKVDAVLEPAHFGPFNLPKHIKRITVIHDLTPLLFPKYHRFHSQLLQRIFLKGILKRADLILSNSSNTSNDIAGYFPFTKSKIRTILLGRDMDFKPVLSKTFLNSSQISQPYFLCTGTIEPRKNLSVLLKAYQQFRENEKTKIQLIISGQKGWKTDVFFSDLEKHPYKEDIILTGFVPKEALIELYTHALALIYPSLYEGFGFPILESLSCGTRVICSNNSSLPEVGGNDAFYFDPKKSTELMIQMMQVFQDKEFGPKEKLLLIKQAEKFSWELYVLELKKILKII